MFFTFTSSCSILLVICFCFQVGDEIPSVDLFEETPANAVNVRELSAGRKVLVFAVPGAFTPGCSKVFFNNYNENRIVNSP